MEGCDDRPCGRDDHPTFDSRNERGGGGGRREAGGVMKNKKNAGWMKRGEMEEVGGGGGEKGGKGKEVRRPRHRNSGRIILPGYFSK